MGPREHQRRVSRELRSSETEKVTDPEIPAFAGLLLQRLRELLPAPGMVDRGRGGSRDARLATVHRMMLEMDPGRGFAVLSPAFKGNEQGFAAAEFANEGCTFLAAAGCELHDTVHQPLECEFCHHDRPRQGNAATPTSQDSEQRRRDGRL